MSQGSTTNENYNQIEGISPDDYDCGEHYASLNETGRLKWNPDWPLCPIHKQKHFINDCIAWHDGTLSYEEKVKLVQDSGSCFRCLAPTPDILNCQRKDRCQVGGCKTPDKHNKTLHKFETAVQALNYIGAALRRQDEAEVFLNREERIVTLKYTVLQLTNVLTGEHVLVNTALDIGANLTIVDVGIAR